MIQSYLKDQLAMVLPQLEWTFDFYTGDDNTGTVYSEGGPSPDAYESGFRFPQYMVLVRSTDWAFAEQAAQKAFALFHKKYDFLVTIDSKKYRVYSIEAMGEPLRLGVKDNVMEWTVNFQTTIREV